MSYDLAVWDGPAPQDAHQALQQFHAFVDAEERLREAGVTLPPPTPAIMDFVRTLNRRFPESSTQDQYIWSAGSPWDDAWGTVVHFALTFAGARTALRTIVAEADARGLVCFDPQCEEVLRMSSTGPQRPDNATSSGHLLPEGGSGTMMKPQEQYRTMLRDWVGPELRKAGLRGSAGVYSIPSDSHFATISFQKSVSADPDEVAFTINVRVAAIAPWREYAARKGYSEAAPEPNSDYVHDPVSWFTRAGFLLDNARDKWWTLNAATSLAEVAADVVWTLTQKVVPAMRERLHA